MKNVKKITRENLKTIQGGVFVTCRLPNGQLTQCRDFCPTDFCGPTSYLCWIPIDLCGSGI